MLEEMAEKELEEQVLEAGNILLKVPADVDELLALLDKVEGLLSKVEQSPIKSMQNALSPTMNALVSSELLMHEDTNVKVAVAACVSEITRITAPEAPYNDEQMKKIFQVIVSSFERLWDNECRSYEKRVSILETVAKVRSCVVMLDLECDGLILQMFQYFLKAIRENVFTSMETIMSLVLEESEEISPSLLYPLLTCVKKDDQDVLPITRKLGEKVLENCTAKLKPYLMDAIKSVGMSPNDYSKIVASICQETSDTAEHNDDSVSGEHLAEERSLPEMMDSDKPPQVTEEQHPATACPTEVGTVSEKSPKAVTSNGDTENLNDDLSEAVDSTKKEENFQPSSHVAEVEPVLSDHKAPQPEIKPDQPVKKKRGRKPNASVQTPETSGQSKVEGDTETDLPVEGKNDSKEDDTSPSEEQSVNKSAVLSGPEKEVVEQVTLPTESKDEPLKAVPLSPTKNLPDGGRAKRGRPARVKKGNLKEDADHGSPSVLKEVLSSEHVESDAPVSADTVSKVGPEGENEPEEKPNEQLAKKGESDKEKSDSATSDSEEKPLKRSGKKVDMKDTKEEGSSAKKQGEKAKRGRPKSLPGKDLAGESSNKKMGSSLKPSVKSTSETPSTKSKRKRTPGKEEAFENKDHGEDLVGSTIKVWWPDDKKFYEGVVESFDPSLNKHKVSYLDGDEEVLLLKDERWKLVEGKTLADKGQSTDPSCRDASSDMPQKKKAKTNSASGNKQAKTNTPLNKGKEISISKVKVEATKSSRRSKNDGKKAGDSTSKSAGSAKNDNIGKSKGNTPKSGTKAKDASLKTGTKSKVDTPKIGTKPKEATPKTGTKSKDETPGAETRSEDDTAKMKTKSKKETPKTGSKSRANGTSAKGKAGPSRAEETDTGEGKMVESSKANESETKSGKKRRR
ncbi:hypothetical protein AQUCO_01600199v1 [Aquilegia coerulea]|uniref:Tudor domain-containing protein n=2 Tax=Aquilegia coerulea TaxID=218851 RepID=A0A2G5DQL5_AQUCA|nr:hypothetical protein AQUCO_01600199v1 [Aquilegia coerulea]